MAGTRDRNLMNAGYQAGLGLMGLSLVFTAGLAGVVGVLLLWAWHTWAGLLALVLILGLWWYTAQHSRKVAENNQRVRAEESVSLARDWIRTEHNREPLDEDEVYRVARTRFPL